MYNVCCNDNVELYAARGYILCLSNNTAVFSKQSVQSRSVSDSCVDRSQKVIRPAPNLSYFTSLKRKEACRFKCSRVKENLFDKSRLYVES